MGVLHVAATGNAGFFFDVGGFTCAIDALWTPPPRFLGGPPRWAPPRTLDLILVTHHHWDHFEASAVRRAASNNTIVIGPPDVIDSLGTHAGISLAPSVSAGPAETKAGPATVTCFRTTHGHEHYSYLIEVGGFRLLHDGDNEDTRTLSPEKLRPIDLLMLCPWQGSGWQGFAQDLAPRRWLLSHLAREELAAHGEGRFLPPLCDEVPLPERIVALGPGDTLSLERVKASPDGAAPAG